MSELNCQQCGTVIEDAADDETALCPKCTRERFAAVWMDIHGRICPMCGDPNPLDATDCVACGEPLPGRREPTEANATEGTRVRIGEVFHDAWRIYVSHFVIAFAGHLLGTLLSMAAIVLVSLVFPESISAQLFGMLLYVVCGTFFLLGQARLAVRICRDESPQISDLFAEGKRLFPALIGLLASSAVSYLLLLLLIVPLVLTAGDSPAFIYYLIGFGYAAMAILSPIFLMFPMAVFFTLVDQERGWWGSYRFALTMLGRNWWRLYVGTLFLGAVFVAAACTCGIALLFALPYCWILAAVAYLHASGQKRILKSEE
jgi:hypothetical protein